MVNVLPVFKGWTIDVKLKQLRKVGKNKKTIEFLEFNSEKGDEILGKYIETLDPKMAEDKEILEQIWN